MSSPVARWGVGGWVMAYLLLFNLALVRVRVRVCVRVCVHAPVCASMPWGVLPASPLVEDLKPAVG
jgi:hypothetical protein